MLPLHKPVWSRQVTINALEVKICLYLKKLFYLTKVNFYFSFLNDSSYREAIENSANYNTRLCIERRLRMPFLDSQTGNAQTLN